MSSFVHEGGGEAEAEVVVVVVAAAEVSVALGVEDRPTGRQSLNDR